MSTLQNTYQLFLNDMADLNQLSPNTLRAYRYELEQAASDSRFEGTLSDLRLRDLEAWIARNDAAPSTMARRASTFSRFFDWAVRHEWCERNPMRGRAAIRKTRRLPRPIQHQQDLEAIDAGITRLDQPYRLILTILRETGMRVGEVVRLRIGDVSLKRGAESLRVREPKNNVERVVVLGPTATPRSLRGLRSHLKELKGMGDQELLFRSNRGTQVSYDAIHYQWEKLCRLAGLINEEDRPRYTIHQLRHTRGSELLAQGQPIEIIQRVLGHKDIRSTLGYAELSEAQVRAALEDPRA